MAACSLGPNQIHTIDLATHPSSWPMLYATNHVSVDASQPLCRFFSVMTPNPTPLSPRLFFFFYVSFFSFSFPLFEPWRRRSFNSSGIKVYQLDSLDGFKMS